MSNTNNTYDPELRWLLELLESKSKLLPFIDPDFKILIVEESEVPMMVMNKKVYKELERQIVGDR